jgi:hypothetical protein
MALFAVPCQAQQAASQPETLVRLSVWPAPAPVPALKYRLLPELREMSPGNPIAAYLKCSLEQYPFIYDKDALERREKLLALPLSEFPRENVPEHGLSALAQADRAARLDSPDWQILLKLKADGIGTLLPDLQGMRSFTRSLALRLRTEIAAQNFDDAIRTAKTMLAMAGHVGEHPTLIGGLVGIAMASVTLEPLEELVQQRGCPNLYWALTTLPKPFIRFEVGMSGEQVTMVSIFHDLDSSAPMSADQLKKYIKPLDSLLEVGDSFKGGVRAYLDERTKDARKLRAARGRLVESGLREELVSRFPPDQVILLDEKREFEERFDDIVKLVYFPVWQREALFPETKPAREKALFADALLPAYSAVVRAQGRLDRRFALLRHVEALRLYAAEHKGMLPAKLTEISVPLPEDPFTGKPFPYELVGETAHLRAGPPKGEEKNPFYRLHYEMTVQK